MPVSGTASQPGGLAPEKDLRFIGLGGLSRKRWDDLVRFALDSGRIIQGYSGRYRYVCLNRVEISFGLIPDSPEESPATASRLAGCDISARSWTFMNFMVTNLPEIRKPSPLSRCVPVLSVHWFKGHALPLHIMHSDVLPSLSSLDKVDLPTVLLADRAEYFSPEAFPETKDVSGCLILPLQARPDLAAGIPHPEEEVCLCARVRGVSVIRPDGSPFCPDETFLSIYLQTAQGELTVFHPLSLVKKEEYRFLERGCVCRFTGKLSGNAAAGEYEKGAVHDLEHDLRLFRECLLTGNYARAKNILAENLIYHVEGRLKDQGRDRVIARFEALSRVARDNGFFLAPFYGETILMKVGNEVDRSHRSKERCLLFSTPERRIRTAIFAGTDSEGNIDFLQIEYIPTCLYRPVIFYDEWIRGTSFTLDFKGWDIPTKCLDFRKDAEARARILGNPSRFNLPQTEQYGDVLQVGLNLTKEDLSDWLDTAVLSVEDSPVDAKGVLVTDALLSPAGPGPRLLCLVRPETLCGSSPCVQSVLPVMEGYVNRLTIDAVYVWEDGLNASAAAHLAPRGPSICFHCPTFYKDREMLRPGATLDISLYAVAINMVEKSRDLARDIWQSYLDFKLMKLSQSEALPDDFSRPLFKNPDSLVLSVPSPGLPRLLLHTPVREISQIAFLRARYYKILAPVARLVRDEEDDILAWIYVHRETLGDFRPRVGDPVICRLWFAGIPVQQS